MTLTKYQVECDECGVTALVVVEPEVQAPSFCSHCGKPLEQPEAEEVSE